MKILRLIQQLPADACYDEMDSPVGKLTIIASREKLHVVLWDVECDDPFIVEAIQELPRMPNNKIISQSKTQLTEYFQGKRKIFDLPLAPSGTEFQQQAWQQLLKIPYAKTISYGEQAHKLGDKNKCRAVGMANSCNPISIIIPCHRVVGSSGKLVGFAGGLDKKAYLLELEKANG